MAKSKLDEALERLRANDSTLDTLELDGNNIGVEGASALANALKDNNTLTYLNLQYNIIGDEGASALANALKDNSTLTYLNLDANNIGDEGASALANALKDNSTLTYLNLGSNNIGVEGASALANALKDNSTLTTLDLRYNNIGVEGASALANALKDNSTLTWLVLVGNNITNEGASALGNALKDNNTLTTLDLRYNNIGDLELEQKIKNLLARNNKDDKIRKEFLKRLKPRFANNNFLYHLDLTREDLRDNGAIAVAKLLKDNTTLTTLNLQYNDIGAKGAKALARGLKDNTTLTTLNLKGNNFDDPELEKEIKILLDRNIGKKKSAMGTTFRSQQVIGDEEKGVDQLGAQHVTSALAETLAYGNLEPPLVLAIIGSWGSGKSFNFNLIRQEFGRIQNLDVSDEGLRDEFPFVGHIYPIVFNVWTYSKGNLMASLMLTILKGLNKQLQYEKIIGKEMLLKGVNLVEVMEKVSKEDLEKVLKDGGKVEEWKKVGIDGASNVSDALLEAVTSARKDDEDNLANKKNELRALEAQLVAGYINKQDSIAAWNCRDKSSKIRALLNLGYEDYRKKLKNKSEYANENTTLLNLDGTWKEKLPVTGKQAVESIGFCTRYIELFKAGEMSLWDISFVFIMIIIAVVLSIALPIVFPRVVDEIGSLWTKFVAYLGPGIFALLKFVNSKIADALREVDVAFEEAKRDAKRDEQLLERLEAGNNEYIQEQKELQEKITKAQSEVLSLEQSLWLRQGQPIERVVHDRLEASGYEKELGMVHKVHMDIKKISASMLSNGKKSFPRGKPRIVLFVDDLDRCPPDKVVETLEALQLLVKTKLFVVVLAIDARYVTLCLENEYEGVLDANGGDRPTGLEYLEKIIQIAYRVPPISETESVRKYIQYQCPKSSIVSGGSKESNELQQIPAVESEEQSTLPLESQDIAQREGRPLSQEPSTLPLDKGQDVVEQEVQPLRQKQSWQPQSQEPLTLPLDESQDVAVYEVQPPSQEPSTSPLDESQNFAEREGQLESIVGNQRNEESDATNESDKAQQRYFVQQLTSSEIDNLARISSTVQANPRALKRVVNSYKVIKIVFHRIGESFADEDIRIALLALLAMSASATIRPAVYRILAKFESHPTDEGNLASLFNEAVGNIERNEARDHVIQYYLKKIKWENRGARAKVRQQLRLFRSFSYLGETCKQEIRRPFWVKFVRDNCSVCLIPDDVATCRTGADLFDRGKRVSRDNNDRTFALPRNDFESLKNNQKKIMFELKQMSMVLSRGQFMQMPIHNLSRGRTDSIEITMKLVDVEATPEDTASIYLD